MFVDIAKVELHAGKGGDGAVSFRHEIYIPKGGPDGGDGGRGGSIIFRADKDTNTLLDFRYNPILRAEDGKAGSGQRSAGRSGKDLIVEVPVGTVVYRICNLDKNDEKLDQMSKIQIADLTKDGQEAVIAKGGEGGFGNAHFKSSTRQTPKIAELGEPGEEFIAELELKLLADVGLVGLPNAGKSTFLSVVSNAKPEIADYPFTTITPNLGVATIDGKDLLIADIPGLIEGAAEGKGLGHAFLRHVDRTAVLLHLVDVYNDDAGLAYKTVRTELEKYSDLKDRSEIVALTKCEGLDPEIINLQISNILRENPDAKVFAISSSAHQGIDAVLRELVEHKTGSLDGLARPLGLARVEDPRRAKSEEDFRRAGSCVPSAGCPARKSDEDLTRAKQPRESSSYAPATDSIPTIKLSDKALKDTWTVEKKDDKFIVTGEKIEKFARKTDLNNYASLNRLRDIMKKMGIRAELTNQGAEPDSIISIAGKEFTLVEDY